MSKYIVGYTSYAYSILGVVIPKRNTERTAADVAEVSEEKLEQLMKTKLFQRLLDSEAIKVLDTQPSWATSVSERIVKLQEENANLKKGSSKILKDRLTQAKSGWDREKQELIDDANKVIGDKDAEIARLKALVKE